MKQVEQSYRTGVLRVAETPVPLTPSAGVLVASRVSLISAGTEKQILDVSRASLAGKAMARPDLVRRILRSAAQEGLAPTARKVLAKLDTPIPLGYSVAGAVVEAGADAGELAVGQRVACAGAAIANHAEYNAVPRMLCAPIPDGVSDEQASFVTLGAIALQAVRVAAPTLGERVVVMGLGLIGQLLIQLLKANGCRVLGFDPNLDRAGLARELGADLVVSQDLAAVVRGFTDGRGADVVVVAASTRSSEPLNLAAEVSRLKGRVVVVGQVGMTLDREPFFRRELDLRLSLSYGPGRHDPAYEQGGHDYPFGYVRWTEQRNMAAFLELVASGRVTPERLVTHRFPIARAEEAYALMEGDEAYLAILLTYDAAPAPPERRISNAAAPRAPRAGQLGIGFIGLGGYGRGVLLPAVRQAGGVRLTTVVTSTSLSAAHAAGKFGFETAATDPAEALADPSTEVIFVATRHASHARLTVAALEAGKSVFCEKPLALSEDELSAVATAARASPRLLTAGFNRRFAPLMIRAKAALEGRGGPLAMLYRINAGTVPVESWLHGVEGGGRILGEACHFVDALSFLAGAPPTEVQALQAGTVTDTAAILLRFGDGSAATILYSSLGDPALPKERLEAFADGCAVALEDFRTLTLARQGRARTIRSASQDKGQRALVAAFLQAVRSGAPPPIPLEDILAVSAATLAIPRALRERSLIRLTPGPGP